MMVQDEFGNWYDDGTPDPSGDGIDPSTGVPYGLVPQTVPPPGAGYTWVPSPDYAGYGTWQVTAGGGDSGSGQGTAPTTTSDPGANWYGTAPQGSAPPHPGDVFVPDPSRPGYGTWYTPGEPYLIPPEHGGQSPTEGAEWVPDPGIPGQGVWAVRNPNPRPGENPLPYDPNGGGYSAPGTPSAGYPTGDLSGGTSYPTSDGGGTVDTTGVQDVISGNPTSFYNPLPDFSYPEFVPPEWTTPEFAPPAEPFAYDAYEAPTPFSYEAYATPEPFAYQPLQAPAPFSYEDFSLPTSQEVLTEDPGAQLRMGWGLQAIQNANSARGLGKSAGTLKALADYASSLGAQEYGSAVQRKLGTWEANRDLAAGTWEKNTSAARNTWAANQAAAADTYKTNEANRLAAWAGNQGAAADAYKTNAATSFNSWSANRAAAAEDYDRLWRNALTDYMTRYTSGQDAYNRELSTYGTNLGNAAGAYSLNMQNRNNAAGGTQGASTLAGNLALGLGGLQLNQDNSWFQNLLSLYDLSTRNLPRYQSQTV